VEIHIVGAQVMPVFSYTTIGPDGSESTEIIESSSLQAAAGELRGRRIMVTGLQEVGARGLGAGGRLLLGRVSVGDRILFFRQLSVLIRAGLTVVEGLQILEEQATRRKLRRIISSVRGDVERGASLADALGRFSRTFGAVVVSMIEAGEVSGVLDQVLERIADTLEAHAEFRSQVLSGLMYPILVCCVAVLALVFLSVWVIPKIEPFIEARAGRPPWNTRLLFGISRWLTSYLILIAVGIAGIVAALCGLYHTPAGRLLMDRIKVRLPVIGPIFLASSIVQFSRNLASLLGSGVPLLSAIETARDTIGNEAIARVADDMHDRVIRGDSLSEPVRESPIMPPMVSGMMAVGEETGGLDQSLEMVGDVYERLLRTRVRRMNIMLEPALLIVLVCLVAFVGWCLLSGILSTYEL
jgi:type II secretory pathway component PulF